MYKHLTVFRFFIISSFIIFSCQDNETDDSSQEKATPLFKLLSPQKSGIYFENKLTEGLNTNILMYEYFYNGGGVAAGDLNGDDLIDIYFTSNMSENKLYLNEGGLSFKDITKKSGATGRPGPWKTGVSFVDINGDDKLDIYICYSGALPDKKRVNELYINQGNDENGIPRFVEKAEAYGLASAAYSNQTYFFDYDRDGDLDVLLLNHNPKTLPVFKPAKNAKLIQNDDPFIGVRLFQQSQGVFKDVTQEAGISSSELTYGLGLGISDINNDGWLDFYICNDYSVPDYLYINNQDGTFTNNILESLNHISLSSMGNDVADINNDGWTDIFSLDMLPEDNRRQKLLMPSDSYKKYDINVRSGFHHQYMRNMLQLNNGNGTFSEIGQLSGISNTDWSWLSLIADYDNDGWKDVFITNGYYKDFTNMDFLEYMNDYVRKKGRLRRKDVMEIVKHLPTEDVVNYMYANNDGINFTDVTKSWGVNQPSKSNGGVYADLDNDGDLDLITNNINQTAFIYENQTTDQLSEHNYLQVYLIGEGQNTQGVGARVTIFTDGNMQCTEQFNQRGYLSSVPSVLHFGLGKAEKIDSLNVRWPNGKIQQLVNVEANQRISLFEKDAGEPFKPEEQPKSIFETIPPLVDYKNPEVKRRDFERQPLLISELSHAGPCIAKGDINSDGFEDIFIGGAKGQAAGLYLQQKSRKFIKQHISVFEEDKVHEDTDAVIFDANNDGLPDIYIASGGYHSFDANDVLLQDRLYINNGKGDFVKKRDAFPEMLVSKGCVKVGDVNNDGFPDVFVGGRMIPGKYPETPTSYLLINDGEGNFSNQIQSIAPELENPGMITDAIWTDINEDGYQDLVVVGDWLSVSIFINRNGKLENETLTYFDKEYIGWWNKIVMTDFNNDQKPDFLIGNLGTNTQFKASEQEPVEVYYKDFDMDGAFDPIFCYYIDGESYPYLTRDELLEQMPSFQSRFPTYESFADAKVIDIFGEKNLKNAGYLKANHLETSLFLSQSDGKYKLASLPIQAQYAPVYTISVLDYNNDDNEDVLLCGNNRHLKLRLGAIDANYGVLLRGNGDGTFQYIDQKTSGFKLRGDVRSAMQMNDVLLFGINQKPIVTYRIRE